MPTSPEPVVIEGRVVHKMSNALRIQFQDGPGEPFATGTQGGADGRGAKAGILFGFKNGGTGRHVVEYADGPRHVVHSRDGEPTVVTGDGGVEIATIRRAETSTAFASGGSALMEFRPTADPVTLDLFSMDVVGPDGAAIGRLDVIRRAGGWTVMRALDAAWDEYVWWGHAGRPMKVPLLGTRLTLERAPSDLERSVLVGACVDIAIGLRPYFTAMG